MSSEKVWHCIRQRAGPLVKECRSIRPRIASSDTVYERTEKNKILRPPRDSSVCRTRVDRLELRLALFGDEGSVYALTFDREHEPSSFQDVRRAWRSFLYRLKKWRSRPCDYVYLIEGRGTCGSSAWTWMISRSCATLGTPTGVRRNTSTRRPPTASPSRSAPGPGCAPAP